MLHTLSCPTTQEKSKLKISKALNKSGKQHTDANTTKIDITIVGMESQTEKARVEIAE